MNPTSTCCTCKPHVNATQTSRWNPNRVRQMWKGLWMGWLALMLLAVSPAWVQATPTAPVRSIEVQAQAQLEVTPDVVDLTLRLETKASMPKQAVNALNKKRDKLIALMKEAGLQSKDMSMSHVSIYPKYYRSELKGYRASMSLVACIKNIAKLAHYIDAAAKAGINSLGTSFRSLKVPQHKAQLQAMALKAAKKKVERFAKVMGVKVGRLYYIKTAPMSYGGRWSNSFAYRRSSSGGGPIQPGAIKMTLRVNVGYFIAD
ncbi:MAG: DUF541 domain-containing protein [Deltaproteobacteria bacterium]|nr:MAG: DUF541 domain-containing protein [Deltaproteobacteria bacterium]